jgi:hypothetical protein
LIVLQRWLGNPKHREKQLTAVVKYASWKHVWNQERQEKEEEGVKQAGTILICQSIAYQLNIYDILNQICVAKEMYHEVASYSS